MLFIVISDGGIEPQPVVATSLADAASKIQARYAAAGDGFGAPANIAVVLPQFAATITPVPGGQPTIGFSGDTQTLATIRNAAQNALTNNATYLGIASPTQAQAVAQVGALTRQIDGLIRFMVGDLTSTT